ncbi:hypothetical protein WKY82_20335 [Gordonia malaquae]|uniref:hypothetical protein n=1 Tax=Gordonia malaquae TaxID=410332 RepID=UPI0030C79F9A
MARSGFRRDRRGIGEILKTQAAPQVNALASQVQARVIDAIDDDTVEVTLEAYTTDRGAAAVTIADPEGLALQARDGVLTRAAAAVGLEVKPL